MSDTDPIRKLHPGEEPHIGDVCRMFDGPYGTAIVTRVSTDPYGGGRYVDLERCYMLTTGVLPTPAIGVERINMVHASRLDFYTYNDGISNRYYREVPE
jgi:hypothetical protein